MRVAVFHNRYALRGGEDAAVDLEIEQLRKAGCQVHAFIVESGAVRSPLALARVALRAPFDPDMVDRTAGFLARHPADVAHVHNWWPLLTPAVHVTLRSLGVPVVQTLHNYRLACARGDFLRESRACHECVSDGPWRAARHGCWKGSRLASAAWSRATLRQRQQGVWSDFVDRFVLPSRFALEQLSAAVGLPPERCSVVPGPVADPGEPPGPGEGAVYVGRLSAEKGLDLLLDAWSRLGAARLCVVGTGPEERRLRERAASLPGVRFTGALSPEGVRRELAGAAFAVAPSLCDETFGLAAAEALAMGRPVVVPEGTALEELSFGGRCGERFRRGDAASLSEACLRLLTDPARTAALGSEARLAWEEGLAPELRSQKLLAIYRSLAS